VTTWKEQTEVVREETLTFEDTSFIFLAIVIMFPLLALILLAEICTFKKSLKQQKNLS